MDISAVNTGYIDQKNKPNTSIPETGNALPVFIKTEQLNILLIGSSDEALELLKIIFDSSPAARVSALPIDKGQADFLSAWPIAEIIDLPYHASVLDDYSLILVAVTDKNMAETIYTDAVDRNKFIYAAGYPFYSTVNLGPEHSTSEADLRVTVTKAKEERSTRQEKRWKKIANWCLFALSFMFIGHALLSYISFDPVIDQVKNLPQHIDDRFLWMLLAGFLAQMVDGALGMGYGVISTTILLSAGLNPAAISGSIHTAEMFSSGASGYSHYRFGNVNKKLFKTLLIPGVLGAIAGAILLGTVGEKYASWFRPILSAYTLLLGIRILSNAFKKLNTKPKKLKQVGWLAGAGGFLDSFGGGGWGPLVTSTLISKGRSPRYVIGSVSLTEFFVTLASALTFFVILGISHWQTITGLIIGGLLAAPIAARLAGKLAVKKMFIGVGIIVIISSLRILWGTISKLM